MSTKVFVGNLAFRTTDQALTEAFSKHGEVKSGVIITRGRRSLGYGFVEFATAEQAATAVEKMKGATIADREIKIELAKDISESGPQGAQNEGDGPARRRRRVPQENNSSGSTNAASGNASSSSTGSENAGTGNTADDSQKPRRRNRTPKKRRDDNAGAPASNSTGASSSSSTSTSAAATEKPARPRREREPSEPREKIPSKTTLFVANLPFSITDAELLQVFTGTKAKSAHVALTRNGRSRGYGFVEFENEADQQEALKSHQGKAIEGTNGTRNLSLTISHSTPNPPAANAATN